MLNIVIRETPQQTTKKWIICWGLLTLTTSLRTPPERSDLSGVARTGRLSLLWLVAVTVSASTVQHDELGAELRIGPFGTYLALEAHRTLWVH